MKTASISIALVFLLSGSLFAQSAQTLDPALRNLTAAELSNLNANNEVVRYFGEGETLSLLPDTPLSTELRRNLAGFDPVIGVEIMWRYRPSTTSGSILPNELEIYNDILRLSTLRGIQYFSITRNRMHTLYSDAYFVRATNDAARVDDPVVSRIPPSETRYLFLDDTSFGRYLMRASYRYAPGYIGLTLSNTTVMSYLFFPAVNPENLRLATIIIPQGDSFLLYAYAVVEAMIPRSSRSHEQQSMRNRLDALFVWLVNGFEN